MSKVQTRLSTSFLWTALLLATYFVTRLIVARPVGMLFGETAGVAPAQTVASWGARATLVLVIAAAACVAIPVALRGGSFGRRLLNVAPIWLLTTLALGALATFFKTGTVGGLAEIDPIGDITFSTAWLLVIGSLATLVLVPVTARTALAPRAVRTACTIQLPAAIAAAITAVAMVVMLAFVLTAPPADSGGPGGPPGGPGGPPGGPGGMDPAAQAAMVAAVRQDLTIGVALVALFGGLALWSGLRAWRTSAAPSMETGVEASNVGGRSELPGAVAASLVLTVIVLIVIQPLRIPVDNPPVTEAAVWDSPTTADLVGRTCMDCHSNEGSWPWYAHVAPANWLTAGHVRSARGAFNLSELDKLQPDRRESLGERMARSFERGGMPPADYKRMHPQSELTEAEAAALIEGLKLSLAVD